MRELTTARDAAGLSGARGECPCSVRSPAAHLSQVWDAGLSSEQPGRIFACDLNFRTGEVFEDARLVQIQAALAEDWDRVQSDYDRDGGERDELPISVAHAILKDYEDHLPE